MNLITYNPEELEHIDPRDFPDHRLISDLVNNVTAPNIESVEDVGHIIEALHNATDRKAPLGVRIGNFVSGQSKLGRGIGQFLDFITIFVPYGNRIDKVRTVIQRKLRPKTMLQDKKWYQSSTIWSALLILVAAGAQAVGIEPIVAYEFIFAIAGAFGLVGLRKAVSQKIEK